MSKKDDKTLKKCDELIERLQELKKAVTVNTVQSSRKPMGALGAGWSMDMGTGAFHHSTHGIISTKRRPDGVIEMSHGGRPIGRAADMNEAGVKIKSYVRGLQPGDTGMHNVNPMAITKNEKPAKPAKALTPAQQAAVDAAKELRKSMQSEWVRHGNIPNADQEVAKLINAAPERAENIMANQLANLMQGKAMLGQSPPAQPTDQELFGHLVPDEEMIKAAEEKWSRPFNWMEEALKPISARFASEEEELAYWSSIKVSDRDDGKSGY